MSRIMSNDNSTVYDTDGDDPEEKGQMEDPQPSCSGYKPSKSKRTSKAKAKTSTRTSNANSNNALERSRRAGR